MKFNQLNENVQNLIFKRLPTSELIACGHVCHQWEALQESEFTVRHTLVLLIGGETALDPWTDSCFNEFRYYDKMKESELGKLETVPKSPQYLTKCYGLNVNRAFTLELAQYLVYKMPNIKNLILASTEPSLSWTQDLLYMLSQWSHKLETIKLFVHSTYSLSTQQRINVHMILGALNACPMLDHLTVDFNQMLVEDENALNMPILGQLSEFYFGSNDFPQILIESFARYGQSNDNRLTRIGLRGSIGYSDYTREFDVLDFDLTRKFTHLLVDFHGDAHGADDDEQDEPDDGHLTIMCDRFDQLTQLYLNIDMDKVYYHLVMSQLARLNKLEVLSLDIRGDMSANYKDHSVPMPSVRVLKLCIEPTSHESLVDLCLEELYPNLEYMEVEFDGQMECNLCEHAGDKTESDNIAQLELCIQWTLHPIIFCECLNFCKISFPPELHKVLTNCNDIVQEILGDYMA